MLNSFLHDSKFQIFIFKINNLKMKFINLKSEI